VGRKRKRKGDKHRKLSSYPTREIAFGFGIYLECI